MLEDGCIFPWSVTVADDTIRHARNTRYDLNAFRASAGSALPQWPPPLLQTLPRNAGARGSAGGLQALHDTRHCTT